MAKQSLLIIIAILSLFFSGCNKKEFSVSDEIEISTTKETMDENFDTLNGLVKTINGQHLHQIIQQKFPNSTRPFIHVSVSMTKTSFDLPGKIEEIYSLKVILSMNYDEKRADEAAGILKFYKMLYSEELRKLNVPLSKLEAVGSTS